MFVSPLTFAGYLPQLENLDKIKTQNFEMFSSGLDELRANEAALNADEEHYLRFLEVYRKVYLQRNHNSIAEIERLLQDNLPENLRLRLSALAVNAGLLNRDFRKSFIYADDILKAISNIDDEFTLKQILAPLAHLFIDARQLELAKFLITRLRAISSDASAICYADYLEFRAYFVFEQYADLELVATNAINACNVAEERLWESITAIQLARAFVTSGEYEKATNLMDKYREYSISSSYPILSGSVYAIDAELAIVKNDYAQAHKLISSALGKMGINDSQELVMYANKLAYQTHYAQGNYKEAIDHYIVYKDIETVLDKDRADKQLSYELVKSEIEVKNQSIELLNKDNELLFLQKNVIEEEVRQTRFLIAVLVVVLSIAVYLAYKGLTGRHRFKKIAEFDQLTGISNRYHFNNQAELALEFCEKNNQPAAVILFDLDHFKQINDNHGHAAGDWALQAVVGTCRHFMRNNDVFGRIGGEEFAVVLPGCQTDKAVLLAEICRDAIAAIDTEESGTSFPLTASFGVSGSDTSGYQLKQLLADADKAMYRAKDSGRDQVASFAEA